MGPFAIPLPRLDLHLSPMTAEERKALSFIALLLGLSVVARAMNRTEPVVVSGATAVDIPTRLQQNQQARERISKSAKPKTPPPSQPPVPAWRRGPRPASVVEYRSPSTPKALPEAVNLNRATAAELDQLPGVSPAVAQRIIEYRETRGPFETIEQLDSVKGIGPALLGKLKPLVRFR